MLLTPQIGPTPVLLLQDGAVLRDVGDEPHRVVDVASGIFGATGVCTADTMLGAAVRIAMCSALIARAPLISISPSPRVS